MSTAYETSQVNIPQELDDHDTRLGDNAAQIADNEVRIGVLETAPFCSAWVAPTTNPYTSPQDIKVTELRENYGGFSLANNKLVIPRSGYYRVKFSQLIRVDGSGTIYIRAFNGAAHNVYRSWSSLIPANTHMDLVSESIGYFNADEQISPVVTGVSGTLTNWSSSHTVYIVEWLSS